MSKGKGVRLEKKTAERIIRNSKYLDHHPKREGPGATNATDFGGLVVMTLSMTLPPAGSGGVAGVGSGVLQKFNPSTHTYTASSTTSYPVLNITDKHVAAGSYVICGTTHGYFQFLQTACSNLS